MENLMSFDNPEFGAIRTLKENDKVWFCAADVAKALGYTNPNKAVNDHCRAITKRSTHISGKMQDINFIPEGDVYRLIIRSKLPEAEKFESWVFDDILPSVRKNGGYIVGQENMTQEEFLAQAYMMSQNILKEREARIANLNKQVEEQTKQIEIMEPKVTYYDKVLNSKSLVSVTEIAKDYGFGAVTLNKILNQKKVQYKVNGTWVLYEKFQNKGYVGTKTASFSSSDGYDCSRESTYWTQKGRMFIYDLLKKDGMIPVMEREENQ